MNKKYEIYNVAAEMFNANMHYPNMIVFILYWEANIGFGELQFIYNTKTKEWDYDSETMGKEFCTAVLNKWLENIWR